MTHHENHSSNHINILAVFANPIGSDYLRLGAEDRVINECIQLSVYRDNITLEILHAATIHDIRRKLLTKEYKIIQFSGHGTGRGLALEDALGNPILVEQEALAEFLSAYSPPIECVILNACYTEDSGKLISLGVPYTIGMDGAISDDAAKEFARGFYDAIGANKSIEFAFQEGYRTVKLMGLFEGFVPILFSETNPPEQKELKIISHQQVQLEEEEEGFLDYISNGIERFKEVTEISHRIKDQIETLGSEVRADTKELNTLKNQQSKASVVDYKRIINRTAIRMGSFANQLNEEIPSFRSAYSKAIDSYGKAASLLTTDFDTDNAKQLNGALEVVEQLETSLVSVKDSLRTFRESIANLPRMTSRLNRAKRVCVEALDTYDRELEASLQLTFEVIVLIGNLVLSTESVDK